MGQLKNAVRDAKAVCAALKSKGVVVTFAENCTRTQWKNKENEFLRNLREGDAAIIFFAGHGCEFNNANRLLTRSKSQKRNLKNDSVNVLALLIRYVT